MIRHILVWAALALPLCSFGQAKNKTKPAPISTAQFESQLATELCQDLVKLNATKSFDQLSKDEATTTLQQSMTQAALKHPEEVEQLMAANGADASAAMREVGQHVAAKLATDCPVAMVLFTRLSGVSTPVKAADLAISDAERPLITTLATDVCTDLSAQDAAKPLAGQNKQERTALMQQTMQKVMKAHAREISERYGPEVFLDQERIFSLGAKIGAHMAGLCPKHLTAISQP